jgi:membrane-bound serine protease (ClpP class)
MATPFMLGNPVIILYLAYSEKAYSMVNTTCRSFITILFILLIKSQVFSQPGIVYRFDIHEEIGPAAWRTTSAAIKEAEALNAGVILLHLNTYGGQVDMADSIRSALLATPVKTIAYIDHNAASAGALIAIACDKIYMQNGASIGAASVVNQKGEVMPEKYQSYMRSLMRATAEVNGRDPLIAEGFVDPDLEIQNIKPKGKVLTFTATEALSYKFCDGIASTIEEVLNAEGLSGSVIKVKEKTLIDKIIGFLINPAVSGILILLIIGGIYFELQAPGIGFALLVAVLAAVLYFAPLYLEGLASHWEILLFVTGVILIALEIFVIPGFGFVGIAGLLCMICGLAFSLVMNDYFNFSPSGQRSLTNAFLIVLAGLAGAVAVSFALGKNILNSPLFRRLVLEDEQRSEHGYTIAEKGGSSLKGESAIAVTDLRPSGKIEIGEHRYDALSEDGFIHKGEMLVVTRHETMSIFVKRKK